MIINVTQESTSEELEWVEVIWHVHQSILQLKCVLFLLLDVCGHIVLDVFVLSFCEVSNFEGALLMLCDAGAGVFNHLFNFGVVWPLTSLAHLRRLLRHCPTMSKAGRCCIWDDKVLS